ncbi:MAG: serine protein kinase PrkA, partial [Deltaproteobacteria bacterium]|nr:serine protein kinase PrkA [Deltaproteobacteria bacterium]
MGENGNKSLNYHLEQVRDAVVPFEDAFQSVARMVLDNKDLIEKVTVQGKITYDFKIFRQGKKHVIGMFDEINSFVSYVKDAAQGGSSREMAFVLVGEPGNGKTFFVDFLCALYRKFIAEEGNRRYTFNFKGLDRLGTYGKIQTIPSQTFEDPMILMMNFFESQEDSKAYLSQQIGFSDDQIDRMFESYRPLGACSDYILNNIRNHTNGHLEEMMDFFEVVPVPLSESMGTVTGKYSAKDKITSSAVDLLGEESIQRLLHISDPNNPYRLD